MVAPGRERDVTVSKKGEIGAGGGGTPTAGN